MRRPLAAATLVLACTACGGSSEDDSGPAPTTASAQPSRQPSQGSSPLSPRVIRTVADHLEVPWGITFLPDESALVTERDSGRVLHIVGDEVSEAGRIGESHAEGEGGLLGIAVSPTFDDDHHVFIYTSTDDDNRVLRATSQTAGSARPRPILTGIPKGFIHDGGQLVFGPDGYLYVSTGETGEQSIWPRTATASAARSCGSPRTASRRRATRSTTRSGPTATATSRDSPSTTRAGCGRASSGSRRGTSST